MVNQIFFIIVPQRYEKKLKAQKNLSQIAYFNGDNSIFEKANHFLPKSFNDAPI
jgi:hypothetical protein